MKPGKIEVALVIVLITENDLRRPQLAIGAN